MSILSSHAWFAWEHARPRSGIAVGAAVMTESGAIWMGCNVELEFRLGMHAEVNALSTMLANSPSSRPVAILIAAEAELFTPCGGCLDWIMQLGGAGCVIMHEAKVGEQELCQPAGKLMPFYPRA